jgi:thiosulfate reductase cytochrome b subunit
MGGLLSGFEVGVVATENAVLFVLLAFAFGFLLSNSLALRYRERYLNVSWRLDRQNGVVRALRKWR